MVYPPAIASRRIASIPNRRTHPPKQNRHAGTASSTLGRIVDPISTGLRAASTPLSPIRRRPRWSLLDHYRLCPNRGLVQPRFGKALAVNRYAFTRRRRCGSAFPKREELGRAPSQICGAQAGVLRDPCEHPRADFLSIMKRPYVVRPPSAGQHPMGSVASSLLDPADSE
jgi:hypothetical protein